LSVIMMLRVKADPDALERYANENADQVKRIAEDGRSKGAIHHYFAAGDGEVVVIDEWDSEESFQGFFDSQAEIPEVMQAAGAASEPEVTFLRKLSTPDEF
jgi:heme-degrading monooxygenase HmoA